MMFSIFPTQILIDKGAFVNPIMRNRKGHLMTPLDTALYRGFRGCAKFIQLHGGVTAGKITDKNALERAMSKSVWQIFKLEKNIDFFLQQSPDEQITGVTDGRSFEGR